MKKIAKLLKADINATSDLVEIAAMLASKGRGKDTILAHITPKEAQILKDMGGSGTTNPETGLLEFQPEGGDVYVEPVTEQFGDFQPGGQTPQEVAAAYPDLYPRGEIAKEPYTGTVFYPSEGGLANIQPTATQQDIQNAYLKATTAPGDVSVAPRLPTAREAFELGQVAQPSPAPEKFDFLEKLGKLATPEMARLGLAGAGALVGASTARKAAEQGRAAKAELQTLAQPYQQTGAQIQAQAQRGELTPVGQQSLQAMQARLAQGVESRGGVGAQQAAAQLEAMRQSLLQQQMDYGLKISGIGDNIAMGAIRTGLQADQAVNQLTNSMYSNMLYLASGMYPGAGRATTVAER